jgi:hypothetical protein
MLPHQCPITSLLNGKWLPAFGIVRRCVLLCEGCILLTDNCIPWIIDCVRELREVRLVLVSMLVGLP